MKLTEKVGNVVNKTKFNIKKHSPEILVIAGAVGVVASAVMACKATTKLSEITTKHKDDVELINQLVEHPEMVPENQTYTQEDAKKDLRITHTKTALKVARLYAPSVILGTLSLTCMLTSNGILRKRNAGIAAAYAAVDKGFKAYRNNVIERFGEEVDKELKYGIKAKEVEEVTVDKDGKEKKVKKTVEVVSDDGISPYAKFFDELCKEWESDADHNLWFLKQQQNWANDKLKANGHLFLNEVYDMLGIPRTKAGAVVGWLYRPNDSNHKGNNYVDFGIYNIKRESNRDFVNGHESSILLDFNVDGVIYDKI